MKHCWLIVLGIVVLVACSEQESTTLQPQQSQPSLTPEELEIQAPEQPDYSSPKTTIAVPEFREVDWQELIPEDYTFDFIKTQIDLESYDIANLQDGDPEAQRLYRDMQALMRKAPVISELDSEKIKIPGFVVPLEIDGNIVYSFLLVPYFGACIHTPPPPANQIVYVEVEDGFKFLDMYNPVWVSGPITVESKDSVLAYAGYTIRAHSIEDY